MSELQEMFDKAGSVDEDGNIVINLNKLSPEPIQEHIEREHLFQQNFIKRFFIKRYGERVYTSDIGGAGYLRYVYICLVYKDKYYITDMWTEDYETGTRVDLFGGMF